ncbi:endonuclease/exonuclease/phosphatase family protein [Amaricoccus tamworthensis]|uniref:endonuclease/exonuclease/phosphatase family protein n=1 Tax=Amaricoccus tamworthensis TaxID=57002 RepID=UPI003C797E0D
MLRDLQREPDEALSGIIAVIQEVRPDVMLVTGFDHDLKGRALAAFVDLLAQGAGGIAYPHRFNAGVNAGEPSGLDLDGDGMLLGWNDAWGWGKFPGHGGMAVLSRYPIDSSEARTFQEFLWNDLPGAELPVRSDGSLWPDAETAQARRLSSRSHWDVPVDLPSGRIHLLASNPTPPLFDGDEMLNRLRHRDELRFWVQYLDGTQFEDDQGATKAAPLEPVVVIGNLNRDPVDGAGLSDSVAPLLNHARLQDPQPESAGSVSAANPGHSGNPALDTADWRDEDGPGNLRVDYVLPDRRLKVVGAGVFWPAPDETMHAQAVAASSHRLVWVDVVLP